MLELSSSGHAYCNPKLVNDVYTWAQLSFYSSWRRMLVVVNWVDWRLVWKEEWGGDSSFVVYIANLIIVHSLDNYKYVLMNVHCSVYRNLRILNWVILLGINFDIEISSNNIYSGYIGMTKILFHQSM